MLLSRFKVNIQGTCLRYSVQMFYGKNIEFKKKNVTFIAIRRTTSTMLDYLNQRPKIKYTVYSLQKKNSCEFFTFIIVLSVITVDMI